MFTWRSVALLAVCGGFLVYYAESIKREKEEDLAKKDTKSYGQAALGGDWELTRLDGTKGGSEDLRGNFALIYFGFTFCPGWFAGDYWRYNLHLRESFSSLHRALP